MTMTDTRRTLVAYTAALLIGLAAVFAAMPVAMMLGTGGFWAMPADDPAVALTGHLAFQAPGWRWPLLLAKNLGWPAGSSIAMTDSNPLVSLVAKMIAACIGHPVNLLGAWMALCWVLQPVAATYALRSFDRRMPLEAVLAASVISLLCPAWLLRLHHVNLLGHFLLLTALGLSIRMTRTVPPRRWWLVCLLLATAILVHPYLFAFAAVVLGAPVLHHLMAAPRTAWRSAAAYGLCCTVPILMLRLLSGTLGTSTPGFGVYSMNLLSPFWPQISGVFGLALPVIDATHGQYEGFNYQGAGVLLLAVVAAVLLVRERVGGSSGKRVAAIILPLIALTLLALSPRVYAGQWLVVPVPLSPWDVIFAPVRASGRAFWIVGYALMLASVALLSARLPRRALVLLLAAAVIVQAIDIAPVRATIVAALAGAGESPLPVDLPHEAIPHEAGLLRIVPPCDYAPGTVADRLRLAAVRQGWHLANMRLARPPEALACDGALSDGLRSPMSPGEVRFFLPSAVTAVRKAPLGPDVVCTSTNSGLLCRRAAKP